MEQRQVRGTEAGGTGEVVGTGDKSKGRGEEVVAGERKRWQGAGMEAGDKRGTGGRQGMGEEAGGREQS